MQCNAILQYGMSRNPKKSSIFAGMDFTILPYDQLPDYIRENENLRQILLQSAGIMKYVAEHIDDPTDDDTPQLFVQYQNYVAENYRRANRYNPNRQNWSIEDLRQRALNGSNHLWDESHSRKVMMQRLRMQTDVPFAAKSIVGRLSWKYLEYAWKEDLRRRIPDIETSLGTYKYVMQQFNKKFDGLACRSIDIALKVHHGDVLTETEFYDSFNIDMFHAHITASNDPTIEVCMRQGLVELLHGKNTQECRAEAISMLKSVRWFSQHIYNDEVKAVHQNGSFTLEDKLWLRSILENYDRNRCSDELNFFYFGRLLADVGRLWDEQIHRYPDIDLSELEKETKSFINTFPSVRQITWEDEKQCFKNAVLHIMERKDKSGDNLFKYDSQWIAVYRFAVDKSIMYDIGDTSEPEDTSTPQYEKFERFAIELQLDQHPTTRKPFLKKFIKDLKSKPSYKCFNTCHPWSPDETKEPRRLAFIKEMDDVYKALEEAYNKLIIRAEKGID